MPTYGGVFNLAGGTTAYAMVRESAFGVSIDVRVGNRSASHPLQPPAQVFGGDAGTCTINVGSGQSVQVSKLSQREAFRRGYAYIAVFPGSAWGAPLMPNAGYRHIRLEIDVENSHWPRWVGANFAAVWNLVKRGLESSGLTVQLTHGTNLVPTPAQGAWPATGDRSPQLERAMKNNFVNRGTSSIDANDIVFHVLIASKAQTRPGEILYGWMYDDNQGDPREACVVFADPFMENPSNAAQWYERIARTIIHEVGHALNLSHTWQRDFYRDARGRPVFTIQDNDTSSFSFMNYDTRWTGRGGVAAFWRGARNAWRFDDFDLKFLWHASPQDIRPGRGGSLFLSLDQ